MDDTTKAKLAAAGKIAFGGGRMVSALATATGHGLLGSYLKSHHMTGLAAKTAKSGMEGGMKAWPNGKRPANSHYLTTRRGDAPTSTYRTL
jgi:hypothetical protein